MTKVTMPEPVARASVHMYLDRRQFLLAELGTEAAGELTRGEYDLITTDQAEAYKDACVREALEGVIQSLEAETAKAREHKAYAAVLALMSQAELIRVQLHKQ